MSEPTDAQFGSKIKIWSSVKVCLLQARNECGRIAWIFSRRGVYDWLTDKEYTDTYWETKTTSTVDDTSGENGVLGKEGMFAI